MATTTWVGRAIVSIGGCCNDQSSHATGYYIHSCVKMRYKAAYHPQYLLGESTTRASPNQTRCCLIRSSRSRDLQLGSAQLRSSRSPRCPKIRFAITGEEIEHPCRTAANTEHCSALCQRSAWTAGKSKIRYLVAFLGLHRSPKQTTRQVLNPHIDLQCQNPRSHDPGRSRA